MNKIKTWLKLQNYGVVSDEMPTAQQWNLSEIILCGNDLAGADLREVNLMGANLSGANLTGANLSKADLRDSNLCGSKLRAADLSGSNLSKANLTGANLCNTNFSNANLIDANLSESDLSHADFSKADLTGANLKNVSAISTNFIGAKLSEADFERMYSNGAYRSETDLIEAGHRKILLLEKYNEKTALKKETERIAAERKHEILRKQTAEKIKALQLKVAELTREVERLDAESVSSPDRLGELSKAERVNNPVQESSSELQDMLKLYQLCIADGDIDQAISVMSKYDSPDGHILTTISGLYLKQGNKIQAAKYQHKAGRYYIDQGYTLKGTCLLKMALNIDNTAAYILFDLGELVHAEGDLVVSIILCEFQRRADWDAPYLPLTPAS